MSSHPAVSSDPISEPDQDTTVLREIAIRFAYLRRVTLSSIARRLAPLGVTPPMYSVLFRLARDGRVPQQELVADAGLDAAGVSRLVAKMAEEGLLAVDVDPEDRRRRLVGITGQGRALEASLAPMVDEACYAVVRMEPEEERTLLELLDKAVRSAKGSGAGR